MYTMIVMIYVVSWLTKKQNSLFDFLNLWTAEIRDQEHDARRETDCLALQEDDDIIE